MVYEQFLTSSFFAVRLSSWIEKQFMKKESNIQRVEIDHF